MRREDAGYKAVAETAGEAKPADSDLKRAWERGSEASADIHSLWRFGDTSRRSRTSALSLQVVVLNVLV